MSATLLSGANFLHQDSAYVSSSGVQFAMSSASLVSLGQASAALERPIQWEGGKKPQFANEHNILQGANALSANNVPAPPSKEPPTLPTLPKLQQPCDDCQPQHGSTLLSIFARKVTPSPSPASTPPSTISSARSKKEASPQGKLQESWFRVFGDLDEKTTHNATPSKSSRASQIVTKLLNSARIVTSKRTDGSGGAAAAQAAPATKAPRKLSQVISEPIKAPTQCAQRRMTTA